MAIPVAIDNYNEAQKYIDSWRRWCSVIKNIKSWWKFMKFTTQEN